MDNIASFFNEALLDSPVHSPRRSYCSPAPSPYGRNQNNMSRDLYRARSLNFPMRREEPPITGVIDTTPPPECYPGIHDWLLQSVDMLPPMKPPVNPYHQPSLPPAAYIPNSNFQHERDLRRMQTCPRPRLLRQAPVLPRRHSHNPRGYNSQRTHALQRASSNKSRPRMKPNPHVKVDQGCYVLQINVNQTSLTLRIQMPPQNGFRRFSTIQSALKIIPKLQNYYYEQGVAYSQYTLKPLRVRVKSEMEFTCLLPLMDLVFEKTDIKIACWGYKAPDPNARKNLVIYMQIDDPNHLKLCQNVFEHAGYQARWLVDRTPTIPIQTRKIAHKTHVIIETRNVESMPHTAHENPNMTEMNS